MTRSAASSTVRCFITPNLVMSANGAHSSPEGLAVIGEQAVQDREPASRVGERFEDVGLRHGTRIGD